MQVLFTLVTDQLHGHKQTGIRGSLNQSWTYIEELVQMLFTLDTWILKSYTDTSKQGQGAPELVTGVGVPEVSQNWTSLRNLCWILLQANKDRGSLNQNWTYMEELGGP